MFNGFLPILGQAGRNKLENKLEYYSVYFSILWWSNFNWVWILKFSSIQEYAENILKYTRLKLFWFEKNRAGKSVKQEIYFELPYIYFSD